MATNLLSAFNAEMWSKEALVQLNKHQIMGQLFNRDFEETFAQNKGEIVHTHSLSRFTGQRLTNGSELTEEAAVGTGLDVKLNQHVYVSYKITERDLNMSFPELIRTFIQPAAAAMTEMIDAICFGEIWNFKANQVGSLATAASYSKLVKANKVMSQNLNPKDGRFMVGGPQFESDLLLEEKITEARMIGVGPDKVPLLTGAIGAGSGFDIGMSQIAPEVSGSFESIALTIDEVAGYAIGDSVLTVDAAASDTLVGCTIEISGFFYVITADTVATGAGDITISPALKAAVADNVVLAAYPGVLINKAAGYAAGYEDWIEVDGNSGAFPAVGQGAYISNVGYGIIKSDSANGKIMLNRPLEAAIADNAIVGTTPPGAYSMGMRSGAATLVVKPMPVPQIGTIVGSVDFLNGFGVRSMLSYDHKAMGWLFSMDCLVGVKTTDVNQGVIYLSKETD